VSEAALRELANRTNQSVLTLLAVEPSYPRRIGALLGLSETEVARRLRRLEKLGLVEGKWEHQGKNVKVYRLAADAISLRITSAGIDVQVGSAPRRVAPSTLAQPIPSDAGFVGRARELAVLKGAEPVVLVLGMPGMGKTTLLARYAREAAANPAGAGSPVFWRALRGVESLPWLANQVALFLAQMGDPSLLEALEAGSESDLATATVAAMDRAKAVFVLDEVHRAEDPAVKAFVADAVSRVQSGKLVVASREWIAHNPARPGLAVLRLSGLGDDEAVELLKARGIEVDPALAPRLRDEVGGHPLGLQLLAQAARDAGSLVDLLDRVPEHDLEEWLLQELRDHLGEEEHLALAHASLLRTAFTSADLAAVSKRRLDPVLARLRRRMLVQESRGAYQLHEVVQNFFYSRLEDKKTLHARAAQHYLEKGTVEGRLEAMHHLLAAGQRAKVLELMEQNLDLREFDFVDAGYQRLYLGILGMFTPSEVPNVRHWSLIQDEKGDLALHGGDAAKALPLYEEALAGFRKAMDPARAADAAWKVALCLEKLGRTEDATVACAQALQAAPREGIEHARLVELQGRLKSVPVAEAASEVRAKPRLRG